MANFPQGHLAPPSFFDQVSMGFGGDKYSMVDVSGAVLSGSSSATVPIADASVYMQPTSAASLELVSSSADDTAAGDGARSVTVYGLDASFALQSETVAMSGLSAAALSNTYSRVYKMEVATTGLFSDYNARNNHGTITLRVASAGATWAQILIESATRGYGQSHIGAYTIPTGYTGYILPHEADIGSNGGSTGILINEDPATTSAPFAPMNMVQLNRGHGAGRFYCNRMIGPITGPADIVWIAIAGSGTPPMSVDARILLKAA